MIVKVWCRDHGLILSPSSHAVPVFSHSAYCCIINAVVVSTVMFFDIPFKVNAIDTLIRHRLLSFFSKYWSICATLLLSRKCCGIHPENSCPWSCLSEFPCFYHERPHSGDDSSHYLTLLRKNAIIIIIVFFLIDFMLFQAACTYDKIFNDLLVVT